MNLYDAVQRKSDGRWMYAVTRNHVTSPVGYCRGWHELDEATLSHVIGPPGAGLLRRQYAAEVDRSRKWRAKYHDDGHATAIEAYDCYTAYLLDQHLHLDLILGGYEPCEVCKSLTNRAAELELSLFHLCDSHRDRAHVAALYGRVSRVVSSL